MSASLFRVTYCVGLAFWLAVSTHAVVTNVSSGGAVYATIQGAIDAAVDGDQLLVSTGRYAESLFVGGRELSIAGGYTLDFSTQILNPNNTVVHSPALASALACSNAQLMLEFMSFGMSTQVVGGGMYMDHGSTVTAKDCRITQCVALFGGGCAIGTNSTLVLDDTAIDHCLASFGGGIYGAVGCTVVIEGINAEIQGNVASAGGGIVMSDSMLLVQRNADILDNTASQDGGGVYLFNSFAQFRGAATYVGWTAFPNAATNGSGGGIYALNSHVIFHGERCGVIHNWALKDGGGIYASNSTVEVLNQAIIGGVQFGQSNLAVMGVGGGICAYDSDVIVSNGVRIVTGRAGAGGGIFMERSHLRAMRGVQIGSAGAGNFAGVGAGLAAVTSTVECHDVSLVGNTAASGGGLYLGSTGLYEFTDCVIRSNEASVGGGMFTVLDGGVLKLAGSHVDGNRATSMGGIYAILGDNRVISNSSFNRNSAAVFGGIYAIIGDWSIEDSEISHNTATDGFAGACFSACTVMCSDVSLVSNDADADRDGTGVYGAVQFIGGDATIWSDETDVIITGNYATTGPGILVDGVGGCTIVAPSNQVLIGHNLTTGEGGGMYVANQSTVMLHGAVQFYSNRALNGGAMFLTNGVYVLAASTNKLRVSLISNHAEHDGGGIDALDASRLRMVDPVVAFNTASNSGGGLIAFDSTVSVHGVTYDGAILPPCWFLGNRAGYGGALYAAGLSDLTIGESYIQGNSSMLGGGGACIAAFGAQFQLQNAVVARNSTATGAALDSGFGGAFILTECTIAQNATNGVSTAFGGVATLTNSIVWGHTGVELVPGAQAAYCDIEGGYPGMGNFSADPLFVNTNALDYRLGVGSPCVDTGTPVFLTYDAIGNPRPIGAGYDLGAFEQNPVPLQTVMPNLLYFGELVPGESTNRDAVVGNIGFAGLTGTVINVLAPVFSVASALPYAVGAQQTGVVTITFAPIADGVTWTNLVKFVSNGGTNEVVLIGTGVPEPAALAALAAAIAAVIRTRRALS